MMSTRQIYFAVHGVKPPRRAPRRRSGRGPARSAKYLAWIRTQPCAACGDERGIQAAHTEHNGTSSKGSDLSCIPLCYTCHCKYDSGLRSKDLFAADHNLDVAGIVRDLNQTWGRR